MCKTLGTIFLFVPLLLLGACVPSTNIKQPLTAVPQQTVNASGSSSGAIFQAGVNDHPMFEDIRPRHVGDVLIINIAETTTASGKSGHDDTNTGAGSVSAPIVAGLTGGANGSTSVKSSSASDSSGSNSFTGSITVTVTEVLANGNLRVAGEKQVSIKLSDEYVRFSGVVNPATINGDTVQSTQVADAHVEYKGANTIDSASFFSMLNRIFYSMLPF